MPHVSHCVEGGGSSPFHSLMGALLLSTLLACVDTQLAYMDYYEYLV